jgi:hypothetical protein
MTDIRTAITNAADWLEANPDDHIAYYLSAKRDQFGDLQNTGLREGTCFCAAGRIMFELGLSYGEDDANGFTASTSALNDELSQLTVPVRMSTIESRNDNALPFRKSDVVKYLRSLTA